MALLDEILAFDRARAAGREAPVPVTGGRGIVCLVCPEMLRDGVESVAARLGLGAAEVALVAVPGARVLRPDGDVARAVALGAGRASTTAGVDVVVLAHEGCAFRAPSFGVPGPPPPGESFASPSDLVRAAVGALRTSPWIRPDSAVLGFVVGSSGALEPFVAPAAAGGPAEHRGPATGAVTTAGPVSFFGSGVGAPLGGTSHALGATGPDWAAPPPTLGGPTKAMDAGPALAQTGPMTTIGGSASTDMGSAAWATPIPRHAEMPTVGRPPQVTSATPAPHPRAGAASHEHEPPHPPRPPRSEPPEPPPPPKPAPEKPRPTRPAPARPSSADDPFARAEEILERLRRERRK